MTFITKDNGSRAKLEGGMVRDTEDGKTRWDLIPDNVFFKYYGAEDIFDMLKEFDYMKILARVIIGEGCTEEEYWKRQADLMERGAVKYGELNWMLGKGQDALARYEKSLNRHIKQWLIGDKEEDHAAAIAFNINGILYTQVCTNGVK